MKVIYVDDEELAVKRFNILSTKLEEKIEAQSFNTPLLALEFVKKNKVDIAFLDIEMPEMTGIELAKLIKDIDANIKIIFVTAYDSYALEAFQVDALDYLLKPFGVAQLEKAIFKTKLIRDIPKKKVYIKTFGGFDIFIDGEILPFSKPKLKELLALYVDRQGGNVTVGTSIACLWEDRENDDSSSSLLRMTNKRLKEFLTENGIGFILSDDFRGVNIDSFTCDYYELLKTRDVRKTEYADNYMPEYSWAEETNGKLYSIFFGVK